MGEDTAMRAADYARLTLLAAIWGGAFAFLRVVAPALGAAWTAELRVLIGGLALLAWLRFAGVDVGLRRHARTYLLFGTVIIAIPFVLFAYAATHAPGSLLAIVNSASPMFGVAWSVAFRDERLSGKRLLGLVLGAAGVALIVGPVDARSDPQFYRAIAAALAAGGAYGLTGVFMKRFARGASPRGMAAGNQLGAAVALLPLLAFVPAQAAPSALVIANLLGLALLASAIAFVLYFRLIADVGATRALTVTYLIPLFGVLWGWLFLGESLPASALAGGVLILAGTVLVTKG
jgi:drug/metabolite transporter (DMT)-like permease